MAWSFPYLTSGAFDKAIARGDIPAAAMDDALLCRAELIRMEGTIITPSGHQVYRDPDVWLLRMRDFSWVPLPLTSAASLADVKAHCAGLPTDTRTLPMVGRLFGRTDQSGIAGTHITGGR